MGQTLSEPVTQKETTICQNENLKVGASCMQGWRISITLSRLLFVSIKRFYSQRISSKSNSLSSVI